MAIEIEHKFLVRGKLADVIIPVKSLNITQAYLSTDPEKTIRVRIIGGESLMTVKGKASGASRVEIEFPIPLDKALQLLENFGEHVVEKTRHYVEFAGKTWEVDEFKGLNKGLIISEIELSDENESYSLPDWAGENVTLDPKYANSNLALKPFTTW